MITIEINLEYMYGMLFIRLSGVLDKKTFLELNDCLDKMIYDKGLKNFVLNLSNLEYIDEVAIQGIINRYFDIVLNDGKLVICGYNDQFKINNKTKYIFDSIEHTSNELKALKIINL